MKHDALIHKCRLCGALVYTFPVPFPDFEPPDFEKVKELNPNYFTTHKCSNGHTGICDLSGYKLEATP